LTYAQNLLEKQPPAHVVAMLLRMAEKPLPREPMEVAAAEPRAWEPTKPRIAPSHRDGHAESNHRTGNFVRFSMSWGSKHGATTSRCMSHVCRRGGITNQSIGAIDVQIEATTVEVSEDVAADFERRCKKPDARDPTVHIVREGVGAVRPRAPVVRDARGNHTFRPPHLREELGTAPTGPRVKRAARRQRTSARPPEA
jgi:hypothetical protein